MTQATTNQHIYQGSLLLDEHQRYCIYEAERPASQMITLTSGLVLELLLEASSKWIVDRVEGDGQDYWCFMRSGDKLKLTEGLLVRYLEPRYSMPNGTQPLSLLTGTDQ